MKLLYSEFLSWKHKNAVNSRFQRTIIARTARISGNVILDDNVVINENVQLSGSISIGRGSFVNGPSVIGAAKGGKVTIGSFCSIAGFVYVVSGNHNLRTPSTFQISSGKYAPTFKNNLGKSDPILIGNDVWIGTHAVILSGVTVGHGAVIAAGAVVCNDVKPYSVVAGVPAKHIKYRFDEEQIEKLLKLEWWNWSDKEIEGNKEFFNKYFS